MMFKAFRIRIPAEALDRAFKYVPEDFRRRKKDGTIQDYQCVGFMIYSKNGKLAKVDVYTYRGER